MSQNAKLISKSHNLSTYIKMRLWNNKLMSVFLALVIMILMAATIAIFSVSRNNVKQHVINVSMIHKFIAQNDCSTKSLDAVSAEQPSMQNKQDSILLLSYRSSCLIQNANYKEAGQALDQLKMYYSAENDTPDMNRVNQEIALNTQALAHPLTHVVRATPDISSTQENYIHQVYSQGAK